MMQDLIFVGDKVPSLLAVAGDNGAGHGQFYPEIQFDGGIDNRVKAKIFSMRSGFLGFRRTPIRASMS